MKHKIKISELRLIIRRTLLTELFGRDVVTGEKKPSLLDRLKSGGAVSGGGSYGGYGGGGGLYDDYYGDYDYDYDGYGDYGDDGDGGGDIGESDEVDEKEDGELLTQIVTPTD